MNITKHVIEGEGKTIEYLSNAIDVRAMLLDKGYDLKEIRTITKILEVIA